MKNLSILIFTLIPDISFSQKVYLLNSNQSDLKVFVVEYENFKVYKVDYSNQTKMDIGIL